MAASDMSDTYSVRVRDRGVRAARLHGRAALVVAVLAALVAAGVQQAPAARAEQSAPLGFRQDGFAPRDVPEHLRPWQRVTPTTQVTTSLDAEGVAVVIRPDGKTYDHPVRQAQWGLRSIRTWRLTGDATQLTAARRQADRLIAERVEARGAWWFPYEFPFSIAAERLELTAPWYSGMAQGEALGLFSQLAGILAEAAPDAAAAYRSAADLAFASLRLGPEERPWVSMTDGQGYLWIQEYPQDPPTESDFTYNGFGFAALGIWDYWHLTRSADAAALFDGAVTTMAHAFPAFRRAAWASVYGLRGDRPHLTYHLVHTDQLLQLGWLTGSAQLETSSDTLQADYPAPLQSGQVRFAAGRHQLVKFDRDGAVIKTGVLSLRSASGAPGDRRARVRGRSGLYYHVSAGAAAGWWVRESSAVRMQGIRLLREYHPVLPMRFAAGSTYVLSVFDSLGRTTSSRTFRPTQDVREAYDRRAVVNGTIVVRVASGPHALRWVPLAHVRVA